MTKKIVHKWEPVDTGKLYDSLPVAIEYLHSLIYFRHFET